MAFVYLKVERKAHLLLDKVCAGARWPRSQGACGYVSFPTWLLIPLKRGKKLVDLISSVYEILNEVE